jgi:Spy/CpxP family protein refolding chaperone
MEYGRYKATLKEKIPMRKFWTTALAACTLSLAIIVPARAFPQQQDAPPPSNPGDQPPPPSGKPGHGGNMEKRLDVMTQQLNLTNDQRDKLRPILKQETERIKEIRSNPNLTQNEIHKKTQMVRKSTRQQIAQVLTPDQNKQWREIQEGHHAANNPAGQPDHPAGDNPGAPSAPPNAPPPNN